MHEAQRALSDKQAELAKHDGRTRRALDARRIRRRSKSSRCRTQVEALKERLDGAGNELKTVEDRRDAERVELKAATQELPEERGKVENLGRRVAELEQQLVAQTTEAEMLGRRAQDLESRLERAIARCSTESEFELKQLRERNRSRAQDRSRPAHRHRRDRRPRELRRRRQLKAENAQFEAELRSHRRGARAARPRARRHEARDRGNLGVRAGGKCAAARAHQ